MLSTKHKCYLKLSPTVNVSIEKWREVIPLRVITLREASLSRFRQIVPDLFPKYFVILKVLDYGNCSTTITKESTLK